MKSYFEVIKCAFSQIYAIIFTGTFLAMNSFDVKKKMMFPFSIVFLLPYTFY